MREFKDEMANTYFGFARCAAYAEKTKGFLIVDVPQLN